MLFNVTHTTLYTYDRPVLLGPHVIRLRPRYDGSQRTRDFWLHIEPEPVAVTDYMDPESNGVTHAWFSDNTDRLCVSAAFTVETLRSNPFDYLLEPEFAQLPVAYKGDLTHRLASYRSAFNGNPLVSEFADSLAKQAGAEPLAFLTALNSHLHQAFHRELRAEGKPQSPEFTLLHKKGACRDLTVLFMAACQAQGLAVRFVSGYKKGSMERQERYLHAWPEVYLPGGGWRGYDPTLGLAVADGHVAVAASRTPEGAMPIEGTFGGPAVARMEFTLKIAVS